MDKAPMSEVTFYGAGVGVMLGHMLRTLPALGNFLVAGCSDPALMAMNPSNGEVGQRFFENSCTGNYGHISFSDETYTGSWAAVADPSAAAFYLLNAYSTVGQIALQNTTAQFNTLAKAHVVDPNVCV